MRTTARTATPRAKVSEIPGKVLSRVRVITSVRFILFIPMPAVLAGMPLLPMLSEETKKSDSCETMSFTS